MPQSMGGSGLDRFKKAIELNFRIRPVGLVLAAAYAASCLISRQFSLASSSCPQASGQRHC